MKVKVEKFPIRHNGKKYLLGEIFDIDKKETEELLKKGYISVIEADEETIEEEKIETTEEVIIPEGKVEITEEEVIIPKEKTEITEEEIENSELSKKNKNKNTKKK